MASNLERAIKIATEAHDGQVRMGGEPYIVHPLGVAELLRKQGHSETTQTLGVLHDTVEDTPLTFSDLRNEGFDDEVLLPLDYLTKRDDPEFYERLLAGLNQQQYRDYVMLLASGYMSPRHALSLIRVAYSPFPRTRPVKTADGSKNLDDTVKLIDMNAPDPRHVRQLVKYGHSVTYLTSFPIVLT